MNDLPRSRLLSSVHAALRRSPIVTLSGPRQCGKTTLARAIAVERNARFFDLENPADARQLEQPMTSLAPLEGLVVIDEAQLRPELAPILRVLADRRPNPASFLLLGSASPELIRGTSETLAGRVAFVDMGGFELEEVGSNKWRDLWHRGGFPRSFLAEGEDASHAWRQDFIQTFLERDMRRYGIQIPAASLRRLWTMLAHYHGQVGNASEIGRSLGDAHSTIKRHIDILTGAFMVRQLQPWHENLGKRQVKSPKLYVRDTGLLHALLDLGSSNSIESHPKIGTSWEGFCIETILRRVGGQNAWFWGTYADAELDLLIHHEGRRIGFEFKVADAPGFTCSMHIAHQDLKLDRLLVVYPGVGGSYTLDVKTEVVAIEDLEDKLEAILRQ